MEGNKIVAEALITLIKQLSLVLEAAFWPAIGSEAAAGQPFSTFRSLLNSITESGSLKRFLVVHELQFLVAEPRRA